MLATLLVLHLALQGGRPPQTGQRTIVRDSTPPDSAAANAPRRRPVTAEVLGSAFRDPAARELFERARHARLSQDSSLTSYDAKVRQRLSVQMGIGKIGPERLAYRQESAARVQWQRGTGARIEMTGGRVAIPPVGSDAVNREALQSVITNNEMSSIPYFPGSETLLIADIAAKAEVSEGDLVNPLGGGAEAYYTYRTGGTVSLRLPDGREIQLRELAVRPRAPESNLVVGSLWFDVASGQLVRAAYRLAAPGGINITVSNPDDTASAATKRITFLLGAIVQPMVAQISGIVVEYGLYEGRFWLPRSQTVEGSAHVLIARVPVKMESAFDYASVNAPLSLAAIHVDTTVTDEGPHLKRPPPGLDSAARRRWRDSTRAVYDAAIKARRDSVAAGMHIGSMRQCDTSDTRIVTRYRSDARIPVEVRVPCDLDKLMTSSDLPASIFDPAEALFGSTDAEALAAQALSMGAQAPFSLGVPARYQFGPSMTRYNRVEGFSTGLLVEQQLGGGYAASAVGRFGFADQKPNVELSLARTNLSKTIRLGGYTRLVSASDWGNPLSFGSGVSAFLFGRDEGFYYRATGAELLWTSERGARLDWRAFAERQRNAPQETAYSLGATFLPNIASANVTSAGASVRFLHTLGLDPRGFRAFTDLRLEGAGGDSTYGRGALDVTLSRGLFAGTEAALTVAGGTTVGQVPSQRRWFLGGTQTIRGQAADTTQSGNAFWMGRLELARAQTGFRTALFGDLGWAGDRSMASKVGRPLSGVGIGLSAFDGLVRLDVARGIYPRRQVRVDFYLGARY